MIPLTIPIRGTVLQWFNSYLSQRTQFVNINEMNSAVRDLVPNVQFWDLYSTFRAPSAKVMRSYSLDYHLYADDTQVSVACKLVDVDATKLKFENCYLSLDGSN
mgnify:CR=1 FL=1